MTNRLRGEEDTNVSDSIVGWAAGGTYPRASVIIPTKNRPDDLAETVQTLLSQSVIPNELIIVDQTVSEEGYTLVKEIFAQISEDIRRIVKLLYIHDPTVSGAAVARNVGIEQSTEEIIVFLDDDVILDPGFLHEMLAVYSRDSTVDGVSGTVTNYSRPRALDLVFRNAFYLGPFHDERQKIYWDADKLRSTGPIRVRKFGAGGMSIRAKSMGETRFDPHLKGVPGGEDVDFCARLGPECKLVIAPRSRYVHKRTTTGRAPICWLEHEVGAQYYLFFRNWNAGVGKRICFAWLNAGFCLLAAVGAARSLSFAPFRALWNGIQSGRRNAEPRLG